jgi:hypothetical protein
MNELYEGICFGGPLNMKTMTSRFPKGFLLVDKPANKLWIYEWNKTGLRFDVRDEEPMEVLIEGSKNRYRAAEESNYDVIAAPWIGAK